MQASSFGSLKSTVPEISECIEAPPNSSAPVFCPIAACTSEGPARNSPDPSVISTVSVITARYAPKITLIGKHSLLQRQKRPRRVHQVQRRNPILQCNRLRANYLLCRHGEERASLHRRVVGDDHAQPPTHTPQPRHHPRRRSAAILLIHSMRRPKSQLQKIGERHRTGCPMSRF